MGLPALPSCATMLRSFAQSTRFVLFSFNAAVCVPLCMFLGHSSSRLLSLLLPVLFGTQATHVTLVTSLDCSRLGGLHGTLVRPSLLQAVSGLRTFHLLIRFLFLTRLRPDLPCLLLVSFSLPLVCAVLGRRGWLCLARATRRTGYARCASPPPLLPPLRPPLPLPALSLPAATARCLVRSALPCGRHLWLLPR